MAVEAIVPVVENIEQQEEEGDKGKGLGGVQQRAVAVRPIAGQEADGHDPEVREDEVEEEDVAGVGGKEEGGQVENGCEDGLGSNVSIPGQNVTLRSLSMDVNLQ